MKISKTDDAVFNVVTETVDKSGVMVRAIEKMWTGQDGCISHTKLLQAHRCAPQT